jgi:hypothetical protein
MTTPEVMARAIRQIDYSLPIDIGGEVIENDEPLSGIIDSAAEMHSLTTHLSRQAQTFRLT